MWNCPRAPLALLAAALLAAGAPACGGTAGAGNAGGYLHGDGDEDGDDPQATNPVQDDQSLFALYGGRPAPPAAARPIGALVRRFYAAAQARDAAAVCALLGSGVRTGLAAQTGSAGRAAGCVAEVAPELAQQSAQLRTEDPATMVVIAVYTKGSLGLVVLGFKRWPESDILIEREGDGAWRLGALFDNLMT